MTTHFTKIKIEKKNSIGKIILNSPKTLNIIEKETFPEINEALNHFESDDVNVILITAACGTSRNRKKVFSAGVNLKNYEEKIQLAKTSPSRFKGELKASRSLPVKIEKYNKPVIIGINGMVTGGFFELALACDMILVSESAVMSLNEVNLGLIPGYGGIHRLIRLVGKNKTFELISTTRTIRAKEAYELGIAAKVFKNIGFESQIEKYCAELTKKPTNSLFLVKHAMEKILSGESPEDVEIDNFTKAVCSEEAKKGITGFLKK